MNPHRHAIKEINGFYDFTQRQLETNAPWWLRIEELERQAASRQALLNNLLTRIDRLEINRCC